MEMQRLSLHSREKVERALQSSCLRLRCYLLQGDLFCNIHESVPLIFTKKVAPRSRIDSLECCHELGISLRWLKPGISVHNSIPQSGQNRADLKISQAGKSPGDERAPKSIKKSVGVDVQCSGDFFSALFKRKLLSFLDLLWKVVLRATADGFFCCPRENTRKVQGLCEQNTDAPVTRLEQWHECIHGVEYVLPDIRIVPHRATESESTVGTPCIVLANECQNISGILKLRRISIDERSTAEQDVC
mmetsp:Transcript_55519/g.121600  ORF Transcript_55519/g.121600 Transcript_55519/m.121600 type:complete len:246 (-) Transcript_55519:606-1343(-)